MHILAINLKICALLISFFLKSSQSLKIFFLIEKKAMLVDQICFFIVVTIFLAICLYSKIKESYIKARGSAVQTNDIELQEKQAVKTSTEKPKNNNKTLINLIINSYASFNSVVICIGFISETYLFGGRLLLNMLSVSIGFIVVFFILHPVIYNTESIKTPYEYLQVRYGNKKLIRRVTALFGILFYVLFMALHLWSCSCILSTILPQIPDLFISSIAIGALGIFGASLKGFTQTAKINLIQLVLLVSGLIAAIVISFNSNKNEKSAQELWDIADKYGRRNFIDSHGDLTTRYTIWNQAFSLPIPWCTMHILIQPNFSKYRSIAGCRKSRYILISHLPVMFLINGLYVFCGIAAFVFYYIDDPISSKRVENKNQIATLWVIESLDLYLPSFGGICLAVLFSSGLQAYSSGIWSCSNTLLDDVLFDLLKKKSKFLKVLLCSIFGIFSIGLAISFKYAKNTILSLFFYFNNSINSPILGLFFLSVLNPKANYVGALMAFVLNLGINIWLDLATLIFSTLKNQEYPPLKYVNGTLTFSNLTLSSDDYYPKDSNLFYIYSISSIWYCLFSLLFNVILGSLFSLIYSFIKTKSFDADKSFQEQRKNYLYKLDYLLFYK